MQNCALMKESYCAKSVCRQDALATKAYIKLTLEIIKFLYKGKILTSYCHISYIAMEHGLSVTCLTADTEGSHTFAEIDHEIISTAVLLPSADRRKVVVSYKRKCVHEVLVYCLAKLAQEKCVVR